MNQKICIYSFYYKKTPIPVENDLYIPVMVGNSLNPNTIGMTGDDTGISISEKNKYFSELTGIYWVWKNTRQDITGCCHYRRYFSVNEEEPLDFKLKRILYWLSGLYKKRYGLIYTSNIRRFKKKVLSESEIRQIFKSYDAILPQKRKLNYSVEEHYLRYHNSSDLIIIYNILVRSHPEYLNAFNKMLKEDSLYANNMFILPSEHFHRFMEWWFSVLFEFERQIDLKNYRDYQERVLGFVAERLLTTWFLHQHLKIMELPVIYYKSLKNTGV